MRVSIPQFLAAFDCHPNTYEHTHNKRQYMNTYKLTFFTIHKHKKKCQTRRRWTRLKCHLSFMLNYIWFSFSHCFQLKFIYSIYLVVRYYKHKHTMESSWKHGLKSLEKVWWTLWSTHWLASLDDTNNNNQKFFLFLRTVFLWLLLLLLLLFVIMPCVSVIKSNKTSHIEILEH